MSGVQYPVDIKDISKFEHQNNISIKKNISVNIVCMAAPVKRYLKTIWKDASYTGCKESSSQKLTTRTDLSKSN